VTSAITRLFPSLRPRARYADEMRALSETQQKRALERLYTSARQDIHEAASQGRRAVAIRCRSDQGDLARQVAGALRADGFGAETSEDPSLFHWTISVRW